MVAGYREMGGWGYIIVVMWTWTLLIAGLCVGVALIVEGGDQLRVAILERRAFAAEVAWADAAGRALFASLRFPDTAAEQAFFASPEWAAMAENLLSDDSLEKAVAYYEQAKS